MPNRRSGGAPGRGGGAGLPAGSGLPWELPWSFLGLDEEASALENAQVVVLPVPYEATTSWRHGTRWGPRAILEASRYVELYDQELDVEPARVGIHTLPALELTRAGPEDALEELERAYEALLDRLEGRFLVMLGGEHAVSSAAVRAWAARIEGRLSVLQLDAHADLRPSYEGTPASHASAMHRVLDRARIVAVGVRGVSPEEAALARSREEVTLLFAEEMQAGDAWMDRALEALGDPVYLTVDVDYFDPSLMPATGTPEPGGGEWYPTLRFLRRVFRERTVLACDVVELSPLPGHHAADFTVAKLVYKLVAYRFFAGGEA